MKPLTAILLTASLALAFFVVSNTPTFAQELQLQENVIVTTPLPMVKGSANDHFLSFQVPVAIPGVTLRPGSYIFRRPVDTAGSVIQILSSDRRHIYAMYNMLPASRAKVTDKDTVVFGDARVGSARPILVWYMGGTSLGYAFPWRKTTEEASVRMGD